MALGFKLMCVECGEVRGFGWCDPIGTFYLLGRDSGFPMCLRKKADVEESVARLCL